MAWAAQAADVTPRLGLHSSALLQPLTCPRLRQILSCFRADDPWSEAPAALERQLVVSTQNLTRGLPVPRVDGVEYQLWRSRK